MEPGLALDKRIAIEVMGWTDVQDEKPDHNGNLHLQGVPEGLGPRSYRRVPRYSEDIAAAWTVAEKVNLLLQREEYVGLQLWQQIDGAWRVGDFDSGLGVVEVEASTAPLVICMAALALKAVEK